MLNSTGLNLIAISAIPSTIHIHSPQSTIHPIPRPQPATPQATDETVRGTRFVRFVGLDAVVG
ncbi:hypothetical protein H0G86_003724 [Trichoderma simmonsii]|uniref:Uncharacterized protein n=1 Tax=Trichoderma simmonsii TaxID=1491479 RepID=A0A8G0PH95_9HYPO|nr:hypothetical protein H0G86_003724 [Trichoderma simmonsii]